MIETDDHFEIKFRVGACQGAHWLRNEAKRSAKKGKNAQEISDRLGQCLQVLLDWKNDCPGVRSKLNPWEGSRRLYSTQQGMALNEHPAGSNSLPLILNLAGLTSSWSAGSAAIFWVVSARMSDAFETASAWGNPASS
ncbi:MAG: hypothetical protein QOH31_1567, partial [Verrucomicrobiota bacterium]